MAVTRISDETFDDEVLKAPLPVLVDLWKEGCKPCYDFVPIVKEVAKELEGKIKVVHMNHDENRRAANEYEIKFVPALLLFKEGAMVARWLGAKPKDKMLQWLERNGVA